VNYILLAFAAYALGQIIFVLEMMAEHPDWRPFPCWLISLAWPYLTVRRCIVLWRAYQDS
jgi:tryptophan-rich sensory protein